MHRNLTAFTNRAAQTYIFLGVRVVLQSAYLSNQSDASNDNGGMVMIRICVSDRVGLQTVPCMRCTMCKDLQSHSIESTYCFVCWVSHIRCPGLIMHQLCQSTSIVDECGSRWWCLCRACHTLLPQDFSRCISSKQLQRVSRGRVNRSTLRARHLKQQMLIRFGSQEHSGQKRSHATHLGPSPQSHLGHRSQKTPSTRHRARNHQKMTLRHQGPPSQNHTKNRLA